MYIFVYLRPPPKKKTTTSSTVQKRWMLWEPTIYLYIHWHSIYKNIHKGICWYSAPYRSISISIPQITDWDITTNIVKYIYLTGNTFAFLHTSKLKRKDENKFCQAGNCQPSILWFGPPMGPTTSKGFSSGSRSSLTRK